MFTARRLTTTALLALTLALTYLAFLATTAGAMPTPPPLEDTPLPSPPPATTVVNHTGSPVWTYLVVALGAAVLTLALAWAVTRFRHTHVASVQAA
jgi:hypothetical protein